jgi:para-nitrobenzyl esterase
MTAIAETRSGRIRGEQRDGVAVFRGVPYAAPPVGALRWRAPEREKPWAGVRDATRSGPVAPQAAGLVAQMLATGSETWDEDCLTLAVWTPGCDGRKRPVLVWIHGGGFTAGASSWAIYDGAALARRGDAVVIGINYRLGALGFLALPDSGDGACANFGLLDQIAALRWVREHAAAFGGDPDRVTLFGGSAGAMSIATLLAVPEAGGLFARGILQSGAARNVHSPDAAARVADAVARELGARPGDLAALRARSAHDVLAAQLRVGQELRTAMDALPFQPCVDGVLLPQPPCAAIRAGDAARVPLLVGTNLEEWNYYGIADPGARDVDEARLLARLARAVPGAEDRALEVYRSARSDRGEPVHPADLWFAIETDRWFRAPADELAATHAAPVWKYVFTWRTAAFGAGACHTLEVPFLFGLDSELGRAAAGGDERATALSRRMQDAWLAFAHCGDPRSADLPAWLPYAAPGRRIQLLGAECAAVDGFREPERAFWEARLRSG